MDRIDIHILAELEQDARQSFNDLARKVGVSKTPCWSRVQSLEASGAIRRYSADIDPCALGLGVVAFVQVMIDFSRRADFEAAVAGNRSILECFTTAGEGDYLLKLNCRDVDDLDELLRFGISLLPGLQRSTTIVCLKTVKRGGSIVAAAQSRPVSGIQVSGLRCVSSLRD